MNKKEVMDSILFCIRPTSREEGFDALMLLGEYDLKFSMLPMTSGGEPSVIVVRADDTPEVVPLPDGGHEYHASAFSLAEMAFQMNYKQIGHYLCPACKNAGNNVKEDGCCGHLTFGSKI
jgi:hypothetical protein